MTDIGRALPRLTGDDAPCAHLCYCERAANRAEIARLQEVLEDARHYAAVCPPPPELTGGPRIEMLAKRHRIGMAGAHEQGGQDGGN